MLLLFLRSAAVDNWTAGYRLNLLIAVYHWCRSKTLCIMPISPSLVAPAFPTACIRRKTFVVLSPLLYLSFSIGPHITVWSNFNFKMLSGILWSVSCFLLLRQFTANSQLHSIWCRNIGCVVLFPFYFCLFLLGQSSSYSVDQTANCCMCPMWSYQMIS